MTRTTRLATAAFTAAFWANLAAMDAGAALAGESQRVRTMAPLQGLSFEVEAKHAVSYFHVDRNKCRLVVTLAGEPEWGEVTSLTVTRFEAAIPAGKSTRFNAAAGKKLEFTCLAGAAAMSVKALEQVAAEPAR